MTDIFDQLAFVRIPSKRYYISIRVALYLIVSASVFIIAFILYSNTLDRDKKQIIGCIDADILDYNNGVFDYTQTRKYNYQVEKLKKIVEDDGQLVGSNKKWNYDEYEYVSPGWWLINPMAQESLKIRALRDKFPYASQASGSIYIDLRNRTIYDTPPFVLYQIKKVSEGEWIINKTYPVGIGYSKESVRHTKEYILPYGATIIDYYQLCFDRFYNSIEEDEYKFCRSKALQIESLIRYPYDKVFTPDQYESFLSLIESKYHKIIFRNGSLDDNDALRYIGDVNMGNDKVYYNVERRHLFLTTKDNNLKAVIFGVAGGVFLLLICLMLFYYVPSIRKRFSFAGIAWISEDQSDVLVFLYPLFRKERLRWITKDSDKVFIYDKNSIESKIRLSDGRVFKLDNDADALCLMASDINYKFLPRI